MVVRGLLPEKAIFGWKCCYNQEFPLEDRTEMVIFRSFYEKGFGLPAGAFSTTMGWRRSTSSPTPSCRLRSSSICARGSWAFLPTSICDGRCTT
jgi:hypothetical protein